MDEALRATCQRSMDSLEATGRSVERRWKQLGCRPSPATEQCWDALLEREIGQPLKRSLKSWGRVAQ
ncbi:MAG: hypothetical protein KKC30_12515 [Proteobacteria bacterium]|nr:hypothetical protein [Pseudomonadota bacterium]MBU4277557.1 hypothetical protein [Pseudomonadota bacterium]MBU4384529.1 hypothetical protein [Pseudomonadota bacterium]MBU4604742.1 hypothetical protein [Pseudomonadota bacterium]MCG2766323.1 hypothetical protein [Desulfarculaceae bacterium]